MRKHQISMLERKPVQMQRSTTPLYAVGYAISSRKNHLAMHSVSHFRQTGMVLLVSLIMLLMLTLIGLAGTKATSLEEKMAGNTKDKNLAFQAAESALKMGEANVLALTYNCTNGRYQPMDKDCDGTKETKAIWDNITWSTDDSVEYSVGVLTGLSANPRFIIEYMGCDTTPCTGAGVKYTFRITARATGGTESAVVMLQSIVQTTSAPP